MFCMTQNKQSQYTLMSAFLSAYCPSGEEKIGDNCIRCPVGKFKDNANGLFGLCEPCNPLFTTATDGSDKESDCNISKCFEQGLVR